ncbi:hypothetical protein EJ08DRAFT_659035 [Tothia fuscella]|uniref:Uncharacterized protein n=1 Tax=Tothia fuscella TaxID=1048955 RepID=A0A9P4U0X2_9PEZI|nr:hypothetical protein EJ08DRAFT_659035 [Tothia fuscella]
MCIAELNVSLNTCAHRWYHLVRPCVEGANLQACPTRLALEGWEIKCDFCPFCAGWPLGGGEFMLLGSHPHSRSSSFSAPLSRTPSMTTSVSAARRDSRRGSMAISETSNTSAPGSPVFTTSERNRSMNNRVDSYFIAHPESITQTQQKRPGTSATGVWSNWAASTSEANVEGRRGSAIPEPELPSKKKSVKWKVPGFGM